MRDQSSRIVKRALIPRRTIYRKCLECQETLKVVWGGLYLGGTPGDTSLVQSDLLGGIGGWTDRDSLTRRGGRSLKGICDRAAWSPELGSWRTVGDRNRIQSPHRSESRPLDPLARRHWAQLGLSHRRPVSPILRPPVLQLPLHPPLHPVHPHIPGIVQNPLHR